MHEDLRVIIVAPVGQDASAMASLLSAEGFQTQICQGADECSRRITLGAGALLLTEEALELPHISDLLKILEAQPPWSELPLVVLTSGGEPRLARLLDLAAAAARTVTLLERPISARTLIRSVQVALRGRQRQYLVRDLFAKLEKLNQTLEMRVAQRTAQAMERAQKLRVLSAELSLVEERERRRIAEILHDDLQQSLVAVRMYFETLRKTKGGPDWGDMLQDIADTLDRSIKLTRSFSVELAPRVLRERGLAAALKSLAAHSEQYRNLKITVETDSSANPQAEDVRVFLFRAVRELLLNALKHGGGGAVHIAMKKAGPTAVRIMVADQGRGFDPGLLDIQHSDVGESFGLCNIRDRVTSFGGEFQIETAPGRGCLVTLIAPRGFATDISPPMIRRVKQHSDPLARPAQHRLRAASLGRRRKAAAKSRRVAPSGDKTCIR